MRMAKIVGFIALDSGSEGEFILFTIAVYLGTSFPSVECPLYQWTPWTVFKDSLDIAHGFSGHRPWN